MGNNQSSYYQNLQSNNPFDSQWVKIVHNSQITYKHQQTGNQFITSRVPMNQSKLNALRQRQIFPYNFAPKIVILWLEYEQAYIAVETGKNSLINLLNRFVGCKVTLLNLLKSLLQNVLILKTKYGCFYLTEKMIQVTINDKILIWINQNYFDNIVQFKLPNNDGEAVMINKIYSIVQPFIPFYLGKPAKLKQAIVQIQHQIIKIEHQNNINLPAKIHLPQQKIVFQNRYPKQNISNYAYGPNMDKTTKRVIPSYSSANLLSTDIDIQQSHIQQCHSNEKTLHIVPSYAIIKPQSSTYQKIYQSQSSFNEYRMKESIQTQQKLNLKRKIDYKDKFFIKNKRQSALSNLQCKPYSTNQSRQYDVMKQISLFKKQSNKLPIKHSIIKQSLISVSQSNLSAKKQKKKILQSGQIQSPLRRQIQGQLNQLLEE